MELVLIGMRLLLAAVFAVAGIAKLADRRGFRTAAREFGVPEPIVAVLPAIEISVAVALLLPQTAWWGAVAAVVLLLAFSAVVARSLAQGRAPDCNCFGRLSRGPVGRGTLIRNGVLSAAGAALVLAGPARLTAPSAWQQAAVLAGALLVLVLGFEGWLFVNLTRQNGRLLDRVTALEAAQHGTHALLPLAASNGHRQPPAVRVGDPAPALLLPDLDGTEVEQRWTGLTAVLFWSPTCGFCQQLLPDLRAWEADPPTDGPGLLVVSGGSVADNKALSLRSPVLLDDAFTAGHAFGADGTPQAVLVDADGRIASPLATGGAAVLRLLDTRLSRV